MKTSVRRFQKMCSSAIFVLLLVSISCVSGSNGEEKQVSSELYQRGPLRSGIKVDYHENNSKVSQNIDVYSDFNVTADQFDNGYATMDKLASGINQSYDGIGLLFSYDKSRRTIDINIPSDKKGKFQEAMDNFMGPHQLLDTSSVPNSSKHELDDSKHASKKLRKPKKRCKLCKTTKGKFNGKFRVCEPCNRGGETVRYCSRKCQKNDWKFNHKEKCRSYYMIEATHTTSMDHLTKRYDLLEQAALETAMIIVKDSVQNHDEDDIVTLTVTSPNSFLIYERKRVINSANNGAGMWFPKGVNSCNTFSDRVDFHIARLGEEYLKKCRKCQDVENPPNPKLKKKTEKKKWTGNKRGNKKKKKNRGGRKKRNNH